MAAEAAAGKANIEAKATAEAAAEALGQAAKSAAEAKEACLCKVRDQYDQSWSAIAEGAKGHAAAYEKAKNMQCVLDGTAAADCKVGKTPATSPKILSADVPEQSCTAPPTPAPTPNPTTKAPTANPTTKAPTAKSPTTQGNNPCISIDSRQKWVFWHYGTPQLHLNQNAVMQSVKNRIPLEDFPNLQHRKRSFPYQVGKCGGIVHLGRGREMTILSKWGTLCTAPPFKAMQVVVDNEKDLSNCAN